MMYLSGPRRTPLIVALLLALVACGPANQAANPTSAPVATSAPAATSAADVTIAPAATSTSKPTPAAVVDGQPIALRDNIKIQKMLETGGNFVRMKLDPSTKTLYYMDGKTNIFQFNPQQPAVPSEPILTAADVGAPQGFVAAGLAFAQDGTMYVLGNVADENTTHAVIRRGKVGADGPRTWTTLAQTAPYQKSNTNFDHLCNGIVVSPDGKYLFMNSGSRTDHGEEENNKGVFPGLREVPLTSAIFRIPLDKDDQTLPNDEAQLKAQGYLFADGTRNSYDLAFAPNGDLIAGDNGPDADYPEELNWLQEGHHYGFPWRLSNLDNAQRAADYDPKKDGRLQPEFTAVKNGTYINDPQFPPAPEGVTFTDPMPNVGPDANYFRNADGSVHKADEERLPAASFTPHRSPLGLVFDSANALGGDLKGNAFITSWGAAEGKLPDPGRDLLALKLTKNGSTYEVSMSQLAVGFDHPIDAALLGNKLYLLDWGGKGTLWEISLP